MFDLLKSTFELRGASFIPGWINNLAAPDVLFSWSTPIPLIGTEFHLLPILLGVVMFFQSKFASGKMQKASEMTDQQRQQQAMSTILPIVFCIFFYKMPSGLNLYFMFSTLFGWLQQWYTNSNVKKMSIKTLNKK
jgi:YidC/Oxa1 family membrane protein insertase